MLILANTLSQHIAVFSINCRFISQGRFKQTYLLPRENPKSNSYVNNTACQFSRTIMNIRTPQVHITTLTDKYSLLSHFIDSVVSNISVTNMSQQGSYHNYEEVWGFKVLILKYVKLNEIPNRCLGFYVTIRRNCGRIERIEHVSLIWNFWVGVLYLVRCLCFKRCLLGSNKCKTLLGKACIRFYNNRIPE